MIILIGGEKGGTGKSTIATNIAAALASTGGDVLLVDADPQANSTNWADRRAQNESLAKLTCVQKHGSLIEPIRDLANRYQHIIIDAGGRDSAELRSAMLVCHVAVFPLRPSQADLETIPHVATLVANAAAMREGGLDARLLLSMCPTHHLVTEAQDTRDALEGVPVELMTATIAERKAYRDALIEGKGVIEYPGPGRDEIQNLIKELM